MYLSLEDSQQEFGWKNLIPHKSALHHLYTADISPSFPLD